jgi:hypothetical protein
LTPTRALDKLSRNKKPITGITKTPDERGLRHALKCSLLHDKLLEKLKPGSLLLRKNEGGFYTRFLSKENSK